MQKAKKTLQQTKDKLFQILEIVIQTKIPNLNIKHFNQRRQLKQTINENYYFQE